MEHFYNMPHMGEDWFTYATLYKRMVEAFSTNSHFVEIGSWKGKSAAFMAVEIINSGKSIKFDCIDIWSDEYYLGNEKFEAGDQLYQIFKDNISPVQKCVNDIRMDSVEASELYADGSLDFVFIDGDHSYDGVKGDLEAWLPKMKPNSIISGHDYGWDHNVRKAVRDVLGFDDFSDPWGNGCFIAAIVHGKAVPYYAR